MRGLYKPEKPNFASADSKRQTRFTWNSLHGRLILFLVTLVFTLLAAKLELPHSLRGALPEEVLKAALKARATMEAAIDVIKNAKTESGIPIMPGSRGLIGDEYNVLTTTLGNLSAKRSAENPEWAEALVRELWRFGLKRGDVLAVGMSGSFPGLNIALISAAQALGLDVLAVSSVTASSYGANQEGFTWPELELHLVKAGIISRTSLGISLGGSDDSGIDLQPEGRELAERIASECSAALGARLLGKGGFSQSVEERLDLYKEAARGRRISLYVNIGGTQASMGEGSAVLELSSGFIEARAFDLGRNRGVMARMMEEGVPVLSLLNIRELGFKWGITVD